MFFNSWTHIHVILMVWYLMVRTLRFYVPFDCFYIHYRPLELFCLHCRPWLPRYPVPPHGPSEGPLRWPSVTHDCTSHSSTMAARTLYQLLGLDVRADTQNIKLAYRRLAKLYHPDKNTSPEATALFQELIRRTTRSRMTSSARNMISP